VRCQQLVGLELPKPSEGAFQTATPGPRGSVRWPNLAHARHPGMVYIRVRGRSEQRGTSSSPSATGARVGLCRRWGDRGAHLAMAWARGDRRGGRHDVLAGRDAPSRRSSGRPDPAPRRGVGLWCARRSLRKQTNERRGRDHRSRLRVPRFDGQFDTKIDSISVLTWSSVCARAIAISLTMSVRAVSSIRRSPKESCLSVFSR